MGADSRAQQSQPSQPSQLAPQTPAKHPAAPSTMGAPPKKVKQPTLFEAFKTPPPKAALTVEIEPLAKALLWFHKQHDIEGKDLVHGIVWKLAI